MDVVAVLGLGRMGAPMAANLARAGFAVRAWNRSPRAGLDLAGASVARSIAEAVAGASAVVTMLADDRAVEAVTLGGDGVLAHLPPGGLHLGCSTISPALTSRLSDHHRRAGQGYVSAPVFGRPDAAAAGKLWILAGGDAADLERANPLFAALGQGVFPLGTAPQAALAKLVGNFLIAATIESFGEGLALAEKGGLDPVAIHQMLTSTLFGSIVTRGYGQRIADTEFEPAGFAMPLGLKDVRLALAAASDLGVSLPVGELARDHLLAAVERGRAEWDWAGFASVIREAAGLPAARQG